MDIGLKNLSETIIWSKYAKYIPELQRREDWNEIVDRYEVMMIKKYPSLKKEISKNIVHIRDKKVLPSMRALQFAGRAMEVNNARAYNCCYLPIDSYHAFNEIMFLLLGGTGVGYSVQQHHINKLPLIKKATKHRRYLVQDSIIGWADAVKVLMKSYFGLSSTIPDYDFRDIREKGARLVTAGGKAPGHEPLKECLFQIQKILDRKLDGEKLTSVECHDILCYIANSVLAGGIRRSAMISLFSIDDESMITSKYGNWYELNEQRGRANNSVVFERGKVSKEQFDDIWKRVEISNSGEPGIYWTNDIEWGTNPCCEIALRPFQFCNLCEINVDNIKSQEDLNERVSIAAFFGTLQAGFTDFHYLRPIWKKTTEKDALLGIGMTGIGSGKILQYDLQVAARLAESMNHRIADTIGINHAARLTCIKPSGTTSCVLGCSSGIHAWYANYYLRTIRFGLSEEIAQYFLKNHPELCELDLLRPHDTLCVRFPIKAPKGSILRTESAIDTLERVKKFSTEWIKPGHLDGVNTHNVSATIYVDKSKIYTEENGFSTYPEDEWKVVGEWMWKNRDIYNGLAVLPYDGGSYKQSPFEEITKDEYDRRISLLKDIDLTKVIEHDDNVNFNQVAACAGGACEVHI